MKTSIESYIALNNPRATAKALEEMGAPKITAGNQELLLHRVHEATKKFGITAFEKLAEIDTPYRKLILSTIENKSNCGGGCSGCSQNATGPIAEKAPAPETKPSQPESKNNTLMVAGVVLLGVIAIAVIAK